MERTYHRCTFRGCPFVIPAPHDYCPVHEHADYKPAWTSTSD